MGIEQAFSFLVYPSKGGEAQPDVRGASLRSQGKLFEMLTDLFDRSDEECKTGITFKHAPDGKQQNDCRDDLLAVLKARNLKASRAMAVRLQNVTTRRSKLGLLFVLVGSKDSAQKICISRFPADSGILAEEAKYRLQVKFLEKVFMKNATAYKAVVYVGKSYTADFWSGHAVDKQLSSPVRELSRYWIQEFLLSDFRTTDKGGTRRLAMVLKRVLDQTESPAVKSEITSLMPLAGNIDKQLTSIHEFSNRFALSDATKEAIGQVLPASAAADEQFRFSTEEFRRALPYRSIELDNGAIMTAASDRFEDCFSQRPLDDISEKYEFRTCGKVVDERFKGRK